MNVRDLENEAIAMGATKLLPQILEIAKQAEAQESERDQARLDQVANMTGNLATRNICPGFVRE